MPLCASPRRALAFRNPIRSSAHRRAAAAAAAAGVPCRAGGRPHGLCSQRGAPSTPRAARQPVQPYEMLQFPVQVCEAVRRGSRQLLAVACQDFVDAAVHAERAAQRAAERGSACRGPAGAPAAAGAFLGVSALAGAGGARGAGGVLLIKFWGGLDRITIRWRGMRVYSCVTVARSHRCLSNAWQAGGETGNMHGMHLDGRAMGIPLSSSVGNLAHETRQVIRHAFTKRACAPGARPHRQTCHGRPGALPAPRVQHLLAAAVAAAGVAAAGVTVAVSAAA